MISDSLCFGFDGVFSVTAVVVLLELVDHFFSIFVETVDICLLDLILTVDICLLCNSLFFSCSVERCNDLNCKLFCSSI